MELSDINIFVKVIQSGSFTEASRKLGAPKSTVSSKVSSLERRLGVTLLQRTTRKLHLTEEGKAFFQTCARALAEIESAEALVSGAQKIPQGQIRLTAPNDISKILAHFLKGFRNKYPGVSIDLVLTNRFVDLIGEGVDLAIRFGHLQDSSLVARKIAYTRRALFASPSYLASAGVPKRPSDLEKHQCILFGSRKNDRWQLMNRKQSNSIRVAGALSADDIVAIKELALKDMGIALLPSFSCRDELTSKRLVPVLSGWASDQSPVCVVYPAQSFQHPKLKVFIDEITKNLSDTFASID